MSMHWPKSGPSHTGEFQVSGVPYVTTSSGTQTIQFPYLTQWLLIKATTAVTAAFTSTGVSTGNRLTLAAGASIGPLDWRLTDLYMQGGSAEIIAGLTTVERRDCFVLVSTGSIVTLSGSIGYNNAPYWAYQGI